MSHRICTLEAVQLVTHDSRVHYDGYKFCATKGPSHALIGIPRMNTELAWMVAIFWIDRNPRCEVSNGFGIPDRPNGVRGSHLVIFPDIGTDSSGLLALNARPSNVLR